MGEEQRQALARLFAEDEAFKAAMASAASVEDAVRIAREHGVEVSVEDFAPLEGSDLDDVELESASGAMMEGPFIRRTMWEVCGTYSRCTIDPFLCGQ